MHVISTARKTKMQKYDEFSCFQILRFGIYHADKC